MRKIMWCMVTALFALLFMAPALWAQQPDVKPATVILKVNDTTLLATCKGLNVKISSSRNDFQSHSFFISQDDLAALAKKRGIPFTYEKAAKKLKLGKTTADVIAPDPKSSDSFAFGKVRMVTCGGKPYFDVVGLWLGLGFDTFSKLNDGFNFTEGKAKKIK